MDMKIILYVILALVAIALILFPEFRKRLRVLLSGFLNVFVEDAAKTPDGANAIFNEAIEEAREKFRKADTLYRKSVGDLESARRTQNSLEEELKNTEAKCESFVSHGDMANARLYAEKREEIIADLNNAKRHVAKLTPFVKDAKQLYEVSEKNLNELIRKKKATVQNLKLKGEMQDMYDSINDLRQDDTSAKLLASVMQESEDLDSSVEGSRIVHEGKTSTRIANAEKASAKYQTNSYLSSLQKKYNK